MKDIHYNIVSNQHLFISAIRYYLFVYIIYEGDPRILPWCSKETTPNNQIKVLCFN